MKKSIIVRPPITVIICEDWDPFLYPGQVLAIPGGYTPPPDYGGPSYCGPNYDMYGSYWYVCRGDTLGGIARYYGTTWRYLAYHNGIANPNVIYPGQIIRP